MQSCTQYTKGHAEAEGVEYPVYITLSRRADSTAAEVGFVIAFSRKHLDFLSCTSGHRWHVRLRCDGVSDRGHPKHVVLWS